MALAFGWLFQAALIIGMVALGRATIGRWRRTNVRLSLLRSSAATAARLCLHLLPWCAGAFVAGAFIGGIGLDGLSATMISLAAMTAFCAACTLGLLLPNLADPLRVGANR